MSLATNYSITATDIKNLKARVKAEMLRRKYKTPVDTYGGSNYDYTTVPASGSVKLLIEHINKIVTPMNAVKATGTTTKSSGDIAYALSGLNTILQGYEQRSLTANSSDCTTACAGLCHTTCSNSCRGCEGTCTDSCAEGCADGCTSACADGCGGGCGASCKLQCSDTCATNCVGYCGGTCTGSSSGCAGCTYGCQAGSGPH